MAVINSVTSHKILNSRGDWTLKTRVALDDGSVGVQTVPSGASTGESEAISLPAAEAVDIVNTKLAPIIMGKEAFNQEELDKLMIKEDSTALKNILGGNSILSVSLAICKAAAKSANMELYQYISQLFGDELVSKDKIVYPTPVFNILNGGKHAQNKLSFQEFMVIPAQGRSIDSTLEIGINVYKSLKSMLEKDGYSTGVGDEGGFAPLDFTVNKALEYIRNAASENYKMGVDVFLGMDVAAGSFYKDNTYIISEENLTLSSIQLIDYYKALLSSYVIIYLEDGFYEKDFSGWEELSMNYANRIMIVADDLVVTNSSMLQNAIKNNLANAVIVKPNQVGTLSETLDFVRMAKENNMAIIVSHRSGETAEDTFIADLAIGVQADFIKSGAPVRGERVSKYNRLLEIFYS